MNLPLENERLPEIFRQNGKEYYLDPIRKRLVKVTPEETVRQQMISYLLDKLNVPQNMLSAEERLSHYGVDSTFRADIIVHENAEDGLHPVCIIECKAPSHILGEKAENQALDYCDSISCNCAIIVNGTDAFYYKYDEAKQCYYEIEAVKSYEELLDENYVVFNPGPLPERIPFEKITDYLKDNNCYEIGEDTPPVLAHFAFNLSECFLDAVRHKLQKKDFELFKVIDDYGLRLLEYGNHSGGIFSGLYRSFLIEDNGNTKFLSFAVSGYTRGEGYPVRTALNLAIDTEKSAHHALQLSLDDNVVVNGNRFTMYHSGRIGISNLGSGNVSELKGLIATRFPRILVNDKICLGALTENRLFNINDKEVVDLIENLISYALIRDEYREIVKERNVKKAHH